MATSKLWILRPLEEVKNRGRNEDNPWNPWYDKAFGFVARAKTETEARQLAHGQAGTENQEEFRGQKFVNTKTPWLDNKYSSCSVLETTGDPGVLMKDFHAA